MEKESKLEVVYRFVCEVKVGFDTMEEFNEKHYEIFQNLQDGNIGQYLKSSEIFIPIKKG
jgi:hypothetical protein